MLYCHVVTKRNTPDDIEVIVYPSEERQNAIFDFLEEIACSDQVKSIYFDDKTWGGGRVEYHNGYICELSLDKNLKYKTKG